MDRAGRSGQRERERCVGGRSGQREREGLRAAVSDGRRRITPVKDRRGTPDAGFRTGTVRREFRERERAGALGGNEISFPLQPVLTKK
jgi:hypothetical protein